MRSSAGHFGGNSKLFLEVYGLFRRASSQDLLVREDLFWGLADIFETCPNLRPYIFDLMLPLFERYVVLRHLKNRG